jgi:hypothetical protein
MSNSNKNNGFYFYELLSEKDQINWINNFENQFDKSKDISDQLEVFLNMYFNSMFNFLTCSFDLKESIEGYDYWNYISLTICI